MLNGMPGLPPPEKLVKPKDMRRKKKKLDNNRPTDKNILG